jgi:UDP-galactopyranose mutase
MSHVGSNVSRAPESHCCAAPGVPIIVHCHLRWDWVWQRPQQFLSRLSKTRRILFVETHAPDPSLVSPLAELKPVENYPNITVLSIRFPLWRWHDGAYVDHERQSLVKAALRGPLAGQFDRALQWFYDPMAVTAFAGQLDEVAIVYDCMDELSKFRGAPPQIVERESLLLSKADLVFTGGRKMWESRSARHSNCHFYGCGVDIEHFGAARKDATVVPADIAALRKPVLGYFGVVDERIDYELLAMLADANPEWSVVMIGPTAKVDPNTFPQRRNLHWLGGRKYSELPAYVKAFDLCLMPFALNEATESINPTKALEYMASGRMIVSSAVPDVVSNFGSVVKIADSREQFVALCHECLANSDSAAIQAGLQMASENSWDFIVSRLEHHIEEVLARKRQKTEPSAEANGHHNGRANGLTHRNGQMHHTGNGNGDNGHVNGANGDPRHSEDTKLDANTDVAFPHIAPINFFDYLIVGAGYAGSVLAERLARGSGKQVLLVDRRPHIGGNAYDHYDAAGILVHKYGPHIFHTNSKEVFDYLTHFTPWRNYQHRVLAHVDGQLVPIPINLDTINTLYGLNLNSLQMDEFLASRAEKRDPIRTSEDVVVNKVGKELYEKFFRNYSRKAWGLDPSELDAQVTARVPTRTNRDARYFTDTYQAMPKHGFTHMFGTMLDHPNIKLLLSADYHEVKDAVRYRELIFTGPIDEYFDYRFGKLPYRCLSFTHETLNQPQFQPVAVVNYPNEYAFTRITEFKHLTGQEHPKTSIVYEYPQAEGDPYYPIPRAENAELYKRYQALADATPDVHFVGRLATYRYYNMDQVTAQALTLYASICGMNRAEATSRIQPSTVSYSFGNGRVHGNGNGNGLRNQLADHTASTAS